MDLSVITTASYASAAVVNGLLLLLLLISWRGRLQGGLLLGAVSLTIISATSSAWHANSGAPALPTVLAFDNLRLGAWALFIVSLLKTRAELAGNINGILRWAMPGILIIYFGLASVLLWQPDQWAPGNQAPLPGPLLLGTIFVIWLIEQLYRNSSTPDKWAIKYLCMGVAGIVIFDAVLYIDALLFQQINPHTWAARGFVQAISTPLIAISATRNPSWEVRVFVSRGVVFFTSSLLVTGGYLVLVAGAGYFLKIFGGDWGDTLLATLVFAALLGLTVLLSSAHLRGLTKQIITRNFYRNKYEYRDEWLKLTSRLAITEGGSSEEIALSAIRELLDSPGGALWSVDNHGRWRQTCCYEWPIDSTSLELTEPVLEQLHNQGNIINLSTMATSSESTPHSAAPAWPESLMNGKQPWLLIPLNSNGKLQAIIQIERSLTLPNQLDWEDIALVTAASQQVASYLAFHRATYALAEARQFEAYNRLSAFLIHDLKNVVAQLQMVVQNSKKHADNPEFITDAFSTVDNAVTKMNAMLLQLRHRHSAEEIAPASRTEMGELLGEIINRTSANQPPAKLVGDHNRLFVHCNPDRMVNVLLHLVQNAQEATEPSGGVEISMTSNGSRCQIEIQDTGCGMTPSFIDNELFRPFKTTKGNAGMGIGVYESKEYIESIDGRITVSSKVGVGTLFQISLPLADAS